MPEIPQSRGPITLEKLDVSRDHQGPVGSYWRQNKERAEEES